jgi:hypothetical protein
MRHAPRVMMIANTMIERMRPPREAKKLLTIRALRANQEKMKRDTF